MKRQHQGIWLPCLAVAAAAVSVLLSGCGAGAGDDGVPGGNNDPTAYAATLDYCGSVEPTGNSAQPGGWDLTSPHHPGASLYDVSALVSVGGARGPSSLTPSLLVDVHDYRAVTGSFLPAAYVEPEWKMGIGFFSVFAARSAACVVSLAKLMPASTASVPLAGLFNPGTYTVTWRSKWSTAVPVERVPGKVVDGFEFVGNFVPQGGQVYFTISKRRLADAQDIAICYLAPAGTQWDCAPATVADLAKDWQFSRAHGQVGVYVLTAPR